MIRDPFYRDILKRLNGPIDPELFEQSAADILRGDFPTLVPIRGGSDAGMDGAIADGEGTAYPLISTTNQNVIGNMTGSIKSYLNEGGTRRKAVLATSQELTSRRRRNLEDRAAKLGFTLVQIFERYAIADRLYNKPHWCLELLNLTGEPPPISIIPPSLRLSITEKLIGRDHDFAWLNKTKGDRLLVGQPGSGKTILLHLWAKRNSGLFVVKRDCTAIANAIRSQKPKCLILDDAHLYKEFLADLIHLRQEIGSSFEIIGTCWPSYEKETSKLLNLPIAKVNTLGLLSRDEIVEVIKFSGIQGPTRLVREIVDQSQGRPGLAVTLSFLCIQGGVEEVALGDALSRSIQESFKILIGERAIPVLASFAMGGGSGMPLKLVAEFLGIPLVDVHVMVAKLSAGGVLEEGPRGQMLSVSPQALRFVLVRDTFFSGTGSLDPSALIEQAPNLADVTITLVGAKARGAFIPPDTLLEYLIRAQSTKAWDCYAWLGKNEVNTVLQKNPEMLKSIAYAALEHSPETAIPLLLQDAIGDERPLHSNPDHPLRLIKEWIESSFPGSGEVLRRRQTLLAAIIKGLKSGMDLRINLTALSSVFSLAYENVDSDPGSGRTVNLTHGVVTLDELIKIGDLWPKTLTEIKPIMNPDWILIINIAEKIAYPRPISARISQDFYQFAKTIACRILEDIAAISGIGLGSKHKIKAISRRLNLTLAIDLDSEFLTLFPMVNISDWRAAEEQNRKAVVKLSEEWIHEAPEVVLNKIALYESEAQSSGISYPRWTPHICKLISSKVTKRILWAEEIIRSGMPGDILEPFLKEAAMNNENGWESLILQSLENDLLRFVPISIILTLPSPPPHLLNKVFQHLKGLGSYIETLCLRGEIPEETLLCLLQHYDHEIAGPAAIGIWLAEPK